MIYWQIPAGLFIILLIYAFFEKVEKWIRRIGEKRKDRKSQQVFDLYRELQILSQEERQEFLANQPKRIQKRYDYAVSLWGEPE